MVAFVLLILQPDHDGGLLNVAPLSCHENLATFGPYERVTTVTLATY